GKGKLKEPERQKSHPGTFISGRSATQEEPVVANEPVAMAEHEGKAESVEKDPAQASVHDTLHQDVHGFSRSTKAGLQHGKPDLHAEDQERRNQSPDGVERVDNVVALEVGVGRINFRI